ncbi:nuclear transport factor 2 family protein [Lysobacter sp. S4-A87]|uniref:nuclear transport factor 2 family protein n=1 Tax=Lysobacter sp. S4-A87 TaxID=2925843 RepID=UPI001F52F91F|nr:nuclear transport factor 2 family protein [Lysobacter sp. S4-A87]UNK50577.1 nuclear transport factor 2 family protein [Lysobacter sp. S4-A87]
MKSRWFAAVSIALALSFLPARAAKGDPAILAVVESFRTSIIEKDRERFLDLFVQRDVPWQSVLDDKSLARIKVQHPEAIKARFKKDNNPVAFIDGIVASKNSSEETFSNIKVDSDGEVATVTFDYSFLSNGKPTNSGKECWILVRTEAGWKITTVAYSVTLAPPTGSPGSSTE